MSATKPAPKNVSKNPSKKAPVGGSGRNWVFPTVIGVVVLAGVLAVVLSAVGGSKSDSGGSGGTVVKAKVEVSPKVTVTGAALPAFTGAAKDPAVGLAAPGLESVDFAAKDSVTGGTTGSPYVVAFLAHWCPHCQLEVPRLVAVEQAGKNAGVPVIAVPTGTDSGAPNYPPSTWLSRERWPGRVVLDDKAQSAARAYGLAGYPYLVWVDANGKVAARTAGEVPETDLRSMFADLAAGRPVTVPNAGGSSNAG